WRAEHPEREYKRRTAAAHPETPREWYAKNPGKRREYQRAWRAKNPEKERERLRAWCAKNPEKVREYKLRYKAKRAQHRPVAGPASPSARPAALVEAAVGIAEVHTP